MEKIRSKINVQNMGENTSKAFSGEGNSNAILETYGETPKIFADEIKNRLSSRQEYTIADIGSFKGELLTQIIKLLPKYKFKSIAVDVNQEALTENPSSIKIVADVGELPFGNGEIDIEIVRAVLQWNLWIHQKRIIKEISRTVKQFALVQHAGSDNKNPDTWREKLNTLLSGTDVPKLKRTGHFFSSREEIEQFMSDSSIKFERITEKVINNISDLFSERYGLNMEENSKAKEILGEKNFFVQTIWIIFPSSKISKKI